MKKQKTSLDELKQEMKDFLKTKKKSIENQKKIEAPLKKKLIKEIKKQVSALIKMYEEKYIKDKYENIISVSEYGIYSEDKFGFQVTLDEDESWYNTLIGLTKDGCYEYVQIYSSILGGDESDPEYDKLSNLSIDNLVKIVNLFPLEVTVLSEDEDEEEE